LFSEYRSIVFSLTEFGRFSATLWLAPFPSEPFSELTEAVVQRYPDCQPYGGTVKTVIPHVTVADKKTKTELDLISAEVSGSAQKYVPIDTRATEVWLMTGNEDSWEKRTTFSLGR
jgi:hypothetical protein